jgi:hypothetical protein
MKRIFRLLAPVAAIVLLGGFDSLTRTVSGAVTDQRGRPIAHAAVQMENERTLAVRSYLTDGRGDFYFADLSPDIDYDLQAQFDGIRSRRKTLSRLDSPRRVPVQLVIRLPR